MRQFTVASKNVIKAAVAMLAGVAMQSLAQVPDTDGDGIGDAADNCAFVFNADQLDSNADGFGNACDMDLNNDGVVNAVDLGILRTVFLTDDADADSNGDGVVNVIDLGALRTQFFGPPGPGAQESVYSQRVYRIESDSDMDGVANSITNFEYNRDGRIRRYEVQGFVGGPIDSSYLLIFFYYLPDGRIDRSYLEIRIGSSLLSTTSVLIYENQILMRTDSTNLNSNNSITNRRSSVIRENGAIVRLDSFVADADGEYQLTQQEERDYDARGWQSLRTVRPVDPLDPIRDTLYFWNADGSLDRVEHWQESEGVAVNTGRAFLTHVAGRLRVEATFENGTVGPAEFESWEYDDEGRVERVTRDSDADGIVNTQANYFWEDGPCRRSKFDVQSIDQNPDGRPDSGLSVYAYCHP